MGPHVTEQLSAYMDGELAQADRAQVDAHLRGCPACARHLEELRAVEAAARALPLEVPDGYFEAFPGRVRERLAPGRRRRLSRGLLVPAWIGAAAAAVVLALLTPRLLREPQAPVPPAAPARTLPGGDLAALPPPAEAKKDSALNDALARVPRAEKPRPAAGATGRGFEEPMRAQPAPPATPAAAPPAKQATPAAPSLEYSRDAPEAPAEGYAAPPPAADGVQKAPALGAPLPSAPQAEMEAESGAAAREEEAEARRDKAAFGGLPRRTERPPASDERFRLLLGKTASSAAEARALRDAWRALAREEATGPRADEARVRAVEAGVEAWRRGKDERDRVDARREGREYLARADALQRGRVRAALKTLSR